MNCIITSTDAYEKLNSNKNSILIDIRTPEEWKHFGVPKLNSNQVEFLSWPLLADEQLLELFWYNLKQLVKKKNDSLATDADINIKDQPLELFFICKAGGRSAFAASYAANIFDHPSYNIIDGFEGTYDMHGWKRNNLPWQQI